jgi:hypothetical protein
MLMPLRALDCGLAVAVQRKPLFMILQTCGATHDLRGFHCHIPRLIVVVVRRLA